MVYNRISADLFQYKLLAAESEGTGNLRCGK